MGTGFESHQENFSLEIEASGVLEFQSVVNCSGLGISINVFHYWIFKIFVSGLGQFVCSISIFKNLPVDDVVTRCVVAAVVAAVVAGVAGLTNV